MASVAIGVAGWNVLAHARRALCSHFVGLLAWGVYRTSVTVAKFS
jgi:hypothetical protein